MNNTYYLILFYFISYLLFAILLLLSKAKQGLRLFDEWGIVSNRAMLILLHIGGVILFSVPLFFDHPSSFVIYRNGVVGNPFTWVTLVCFALLLPISTRISKRKYRNYFGDVSAGKFPGIKFITVYFIVRILFISVYEVWFRGYLLNDSIIYLGSVLAIALNVILYALLHIVNGWDEVIACIPFGILLCCLCVWQGAVWPAIVLHLALTIPYETYFLKRTKTNNADRHENFSNRSFWISR